MNNYTISRSEPYHRWVTIGILAGLVLLTALPFYSGRADLRLATEIAGYMSLAIMWNLLAGYAGVMSIGQQAFVGVGGYAVFMLAGYFGFPLIPSILVAGTLSALLAVPAGMVLFRLNGAYFAIGSWVIAEIFLLLAAQSDALGSGAGLSFPTSIAKSYGNSSERAALFWWCALGVCVFAMVSAWAWLRSSRGLALTAMRDEPLAASSLGVDITGNKFAVFLLAAFVAGMVGAIMFLGKLRISPTSAFDINEWTANIIFIVVVGGLGRLEGAIVGTLIFFVLRSYFADFGAWYLMALGLLAIVMMLVMPQGIWGFIHQRTGLELLPLRRNILRTKEM